MTTHAEQVRRVIDVIDDSLFTFSEAEKQHMIIIAIEYAQHELLRAYRGLRAMDMGSASEQILKCVEELEDLLDE